MSARAARLCEQATHVDQVLFETDRELDWLTTLSPTRNEERWMAFRDSGFRVAPPLTYAPFRGDLAAIRERLQRLDVERVEHAAVRALLREKSEELLLQVDLVEQIDTDGFPLVSATLFGDVEPSLAQVAKDILHRVPARMRMAPLPGEIANGEDVARAAHAYRERLASREDGFACPIEIVDDLDSQLVVRQGTLCINRRLRIARERVAPLLEHEIGVHVVTRYNGRLQPLRLFESGFANYDVLQEGLATLAEYLSGYLPADRLRILAGRVVAAEMALDRHALETIFATLHEAHGFEPEDAFDLAVRARRGGGLTKDAVYLRGLQQMLAHLRAGGDVRPLFIGKIALEHRHEVVSLINDGYLRPACLIPDCFSAPDAAVRLETAAQSPLHALFQLEPQS